MEVAMAIDFSGIVQILDQTKVEVAEHEQASAGLLAAKAEAAAIQEQVSAANSKVAAAAAIADAQKADVVAGINNAISALQGLLQQI
jgi:hypothetical protein